jgi:hypothetical protein
LDAPRAWTLARLIQERGGEAPVHEGSRLVLGGVVLHVREIGDHGIERVGLEVVVSLEPELPRTAPLDGAE